MIQKQILASIGKAILGALAGALVSVLFTHLIPTGSPPVLNGSVTFGATIGSGSAVLLDINTVKMAFLTVVLSIAAVIAFGVLVIFAFSIIGA